MRARALVDTLAPGVKARDTAERETPARFATSAAVTNARRADDWLTSTPGCTRVQHDTTTLNKPARLARAESFQGELFGRLGNILLGRQRRGIHRPLSALDPAHAGRGVAGIAACRREFEGSLA